MVRLETANLTIFNFKEGSCYVKRKVETSKTKDTRELVATISPLDNACLLEVLFEHAFCNQSADDACNEGHNSNNDYHCSIHKAM